jgi:hypothetical protein
MEKTTLIIIAVVILLVCSSSSIGAFFIMQNQTPTPTPTPAPAPPPAPKLQPPSPPDTAPAPKLQTPSPPPPPAPAPAPVALAKFIKGLDKDTGYNDEGGGNAVYLDRHNVNCDSDGVKRFHLARDGQGKYKIEYTCSSGGELGSPPVDKDTGYNDEGGGNVIYLDRHNVDCGADNILSQFQLGRSGQNQYRYNYKCTPSKKPITCREVTTPANEDGGGNAVYLDRHDLSCEADEVMNRFQLTRPSENTIQYKFNCCKY